MAGRLTKVTPDRLTVQGSGGACNSDNHGQALNRRVEVWVK